MGFWRSKPPTGATLNRAHPQADGLAFWWPGLEGEGGAPTDLVKGVRTVAAGNAAIAPSQRGAAMVFDGTGDYFSVADRPDLDIVTPWTIGCWFRDQNGANYNHPEAGLIGKTDGINPEFSPYQLWIEYHALRLRFRTSFTSYEIIYDLTIGGVSHGAWHHVAAVYDGATLALYVDGRLVAGPTGVAAAPSANAFALYIGALGVGNYWTGQLEDVRIYNRALSTGEVAAWTADPSAPFAAPAWRRLYVPAGAGGGVTVTPSLLTATLTLQAPTVSATQNVTVSPALLTLTSSLLAPTVSAAQNVTVSPALLSLTSSLNAPSVSATQNPTIAPALLTLTSSVLAPTVSAAQNVTVSPGLLTLTSSLLAPSVSATQNPTVTPAQQTMTVSLLAPTVSAVRNVTITPSLLTATLTLLAPSVSAGGAVTVNPSLLTLTSSVLAPTVSTVQNVTVSPSLLTLTSSLHAPSVSVGGSVTVSPSLLTLTSSVLAPTVSAAVNVTVSPALLTLTASVLAAGISTTRSVTATPAQLVAAITLLTPTVSANGNVTATRATATDAPYTTAGSADTALLGATASDSEV